MPFKMTQVIPISKISSSKSLNDLRPISLLSVFFKLFEKIFESRMLRFLNKNNILTPSQFGFRNNCSTELAITTLYDKLLSNLNEKRISFLLFLDLKRRLTLFPIQFCLRNFITMDFDALRLIYFNRTLQTVQFALKWMVNYLNPLAPNMEFHKDLY